MTLIRFGMVLSIQDEDARDVELQREMQGAFELYLQAAGEDRTTAKSHYMKLLRAFAARALAGQPIEEKLAFLLG
jgi:hypothetical protein